IIRMPADPLAIGHDGGFRIASSRNEVPVTLGVSPDLATCGQCLAEIRDPADRRFAYAFTNCTGCGPRLSILEGVPYDRRETTMAAFAMCDVCRREYDDPGDRRFHAQPNACPACGPTLSFQLYAEGAALTDWTAIRHAFWRLISSGGSIAIKGIGGYHLACLATDESAVARLRVRKLRPDKPLAVMARSLDVLRRHCVISAAEADLLQDPQAPIVLLRPQPECRIAPSVAPWQHRIGAMLPYSPLHHLLFEGRDEVLVMTSGNLSELPPIIDDGEAGTVFAGIADAILSHDRRIAVRVDDSVLRRDGRAITPTRLGRGCAPLRLPLPPGLGGGGDLIALGAQLKSTFCLKRGDHLVVSQHIGDLERPENRDAFEASLQHYLRLYDLEPEVVAVDLHPEISSARFGRALAQARRCRLIEIQHHHAHAAACLAEHGVPAGAPPVLAIVLDGLGYGPDGTLWGCEFLAVDYAGYRRLAHLRPVPMPGGAAAIREPWRMALAHLAQGHDVDQLARQYRDLAFFQRREAAAVRLLLQAARRGINAPITTSLGRLFDAVAALVGLRERVTYEGQAAAELEAALWRERASLPGGPGYRFATHQSDGVAMLDAGPIWLPLLADLRAGCSAGAISYRFHLGLAEALAAMAERLPEPHVERVGRAVVLSGGVFQNAFLLRALGAKLARRGWRVLTHRKLPPNDGGISAGQAAVAAAISEGWRSACA
ncbi:MAG TPA: carbamoyltransferase HypF, partial [Geminicoccaceae bacterium]|nr:carbamoyltransferase HypF [Geminicoccaceae bacterium]